MTRSPACVCRPSRAASRRAARTSPSSGSRRPPATAGRCRPPAGCGSTPRRASRRTVRITGSRAQLVSNDTVSATANLALTLTGPVARTPAHRRDGRRHHHGRRRSPKTSPAPPSRCRARATSSARPGRAGPAGGRPPRRRTKRGRAALPGRVRPQPHRAEPHLRARPRPGGGARRRSAADRHQRGPGRHRRLRPAQRPLRPRRPAHRPRARPPDLRGRPHAAARLPGPDPGGAT